MKIQGTRRQQSGFSLIEVLVAVAIIAILGTLVIVNVAGETDKARITKARNDIQALTGALEMYKLDNFNYPSTDQGLEALVKKPSSEPEPKNWKPGGYLQKLETDPWGNDYEYLGPQDAGGRFKVMSYGADGQPGGEGEAADVSNLDG